MQIIILLGEGLATSKRPFKGFDHLLRNYTRNMLASQPLSLNPLFQLFKTPVL